MSPKKKRFCISHLLPLTAAFLSPVCFAKTDHHHQHHHHKVHTAVGSIPNLNPSFTNIQAGMNRILSRISPHTRMGILVQSINDGHTLYQHNSDNLFTPASVNKLFVAIASLDYLKPNYQIETRIRSTGTLEHGVLNGDLYVEFNGDPTLTDKQLSELMDEVRGRGIYQINGRVYLDNTAYGTSAYAPGWLLHDLIFGYAAPLNAVILNENRFAIILSPSQPGRRAAVATTVPAGAVKIENNTLTNYGKSSCQLSVYSDNDNTYHIDGCVNKQPGKQYFALALRDPVTYAEVLINNSLVKNNIRFNGPIEIQKAPATAWVLASHLSQPLNLIIKSMLKESDNLYTNSLLKQIGAVYYQTQGTWQNGLNALKQILGKPTGIDFSQTHLFDGSGLSRYNQVSPHHLAQLLHYAYQNPNIQPDIWNALPIAGHDGTLRSRLTAFAKTDSIHAKTGTMKNSGVSALAGYIKSHNHGLLVFVIMTNGVEDTHRVYKYTEDQICKLLLNAR